MPLGRTGKGKSVQEADLGQYNCSSITTLNNQPKLIKKHALTKDKVRIQILILTNHLEFILKFLGLQGWEF